MPLRVQSKKENSPSCHSCVVIRLGSLACSRQTVARLFGKSASVVESRPVALTSPSRKAWGRIASLIETAKINGVEPFAYLKATLEAIAAGHPQNRIDDLLPWNFTPSR